MRLSLAIVDLQLEASGAMQVFLDLFGSRGGDCLKLAKQALIVTLILRPSHQLLAAAAQHPEARPVLRRYACLHELGQLQRFVKLWLPPHASFCVLKC